MSKPIIFTFYEKTDAQRQEFLHHISRKIKKGDDSLLQEMLVVVEKHMIQHQADFFVHNVYRLKTLEDSPVLWIVRKNGTSMLDLTLEDFTSSNQWWAISHFKATLHNSRRNIKGFYLIENGVMKKLSENSVLANLAIREDMIKTNMLSGVV